MTAMLNKFNDEIIAQVNDVEFLAVTGDVIAIEGDIRGDLLVLLTRDDEEARTKLAREFAIEHPEAIDSLLALSPRMGDHVFRLLQCSILDRKNRIAYLTHEDFMHAGETQWWALRERVNQVRTPYRDAVRQKVYALIAHEVEIQLFHGEVLMANQGEESDKTTIIECENFFDAAGLNEEQSRPFINETWEETPLHFLGTVFAEDIRMWNQYNAENAEETFSVSNFVSFERVRLDADDGSILVPAGIDDALFARVDNLHIHRTTPARVGSVHENRDVKRTHINELVCNNDPTIQLALYPENGGMVDVETALLNAHTFWCATNNRWQAIAKDRVKTFRYQCKELRASEVVARQGLKFLNDSVIDVGFDNPDCRTALYPADQMGKSITPEEWMEALLENEKVDINTLVFEGVIPSTRLLDQLHFFRRTRAIAVLSFFNADIDSTTALTLTTKARPLRAEFWGCQLDNEFLKGICALEPESRPSVSVGGSRNTFTHEDVINFAHELGFDGTSIAEACDFLSKHNHRII